MNKSQLVGLGIRIIGIFLLIYIVQHGVSYYSTLIGRTDDNGVAVIITMMVLLGIVAAIFIKFPLIVANKLLPRDGDENLDWKLTLQETYSIGFFFLGLFLLVSAIPNAFYWVVYGFLYKNTDPAVFKEFNPTTIAAMVLVVVKIIIGIWLLLGARGLRGLIFKLRYAGLRNSVEKDEDMSRTE